MIQVGQVLDKYELLERVGQGGMAVVYRGIDRSLKRVVAIKILHKHLSDYQEARDRFEREAQAVAKLRHENILEIFDYSGSQDAEAAGASYIVTEFIDGQTLKQVTTDRPIQFPEIGAMVVLQVCRALAHAHHVGILHRDVKPENIMVRADGVVKLMDFGISHMVDLERLTVTGQLLGSPAYMAPEHVEGRPLDYRTDVFAAGIVLYQLTTGKLPFEGKNPHEVLKRIAECRFVDPRQVNPQIGNRLGRIILRAMAASPSDRYPAIGEMVIAIENYLEESGIASERIASELGRYFVAPVAYEQAFETRLVDHLTTRGQKLLGEDNRAGALDVFDRVLTVDPENVKVLAILDGINRRRRMRSTVVGVAFVGALGFCAYMVHRRSLPPDSSPAPVVAYQAREPLAQPWIQTSSEEVADPPAIDSVIAVVTPPDPAGVGQVVAPPPDAPPTVVTVPTQFRVFPDRDSDYKLGTKDWLPVPAGGTVLVALEAETEVQVRNQCCPSQTATLVPGKEQMFSLAFYPATLNAICELDPGTSVTVDGVSGPRNRLITFENTTDRTRVVTVEFLGSEKVKSTPQQVKVTSNERKDVKCEPR
ncbi:MAG: serine/threonine-protein kinase [Kofleriaceae bacterium]